MDRPKSVVGVVRGVAETVDVSCLLWPVSGIHGICYLRAIAYFSMYCALPGRLGRVEFVLDGLGWKKINQHSYYSDTTTAW